MKFAILPLFILASSRVDTASLAFAAESGVWSLIEQGGLAAICIAATIVLWRAFRRSEEKREKLQKEMLTAMNRQSDSLDALVDHLKSRPCILERP